jgi:hypothetical protein
MITESSNRINITELTIHEPKRDEEFSIRKELYDFCSSEDIKNYRVIEASQIVMLFPDVLKDMRLDARDMEVIKNPEKRHFATTSTPQISFIERVNLAASGRLLFPSELKDWKSEHVTHESILRFAKNLENMPHNEELQQMVAISEKVLHKELTQDKNAQVYPESLFDALNNYARRPTIATNSRFLPAVTKLLFPERFQETKPSIDEWKFLAECAQSLTTTAESTSLILYLKILAVDEVKIDENGAHFTPPKKSQTFTQSKNIPEARRF